MRKDLIPENAPFDGRWWFPSDPDRAVGGRLELNDERWTLRLFGAPGKWVRPRDVDYSPPIVHGVVNGKHISVLDLVHMGNTWGTGLNEVAYAVHTIIGAHITVDEVYDQACVRILNLDEWADRDAFDLRYGDSHEEGRGALLHDIAELEAVVPGARITMAKGWGMVPDGTRIDLSAEEWITIKLDDPADLDTIEHDYVRPLRHLVELGSGVHCPILELRVDRPGDNPHFKNMVVLHAASRTPVKARQWPDRYIELGDLDFTDLVSRWLKLHSSLRVVADLIASLREPGGYASNHFFNAATSIEGYHHHTRARTKPDPADLDRKKRVIAAVDDGDRTWLKQQLSHSLEPSFAQRLAELVDAAGPQFAAAIGDTKKWSKWVKDGRNSVAHRRPGMLDLDANGRMTVTINQTLRWLLTITLLLDLGLELDVVEERIKAARHLQHWSDTLKDEQPDWFSVN